MKSKSNLFVSPQRAKALENVNPLTEQLISFGSWWSVNLPTEKAGCFGRRRVKSSPLSIPTTEHMVGLSCGSCWTHNKPMFMHLKNSSTRQELISDGSINSKPFPSFHSFHACKTTTLITRRNGSIVVMVRFSESVHQNIFHYYTFKVSQKMHPFLKNFKKIWFENRQPNKFC